MKIVSVEKAESKFFKKIQKCDSHLIHFEPDYKPKISFFSVFVVDCKTKLEQHFSSSLISLQSRQFFQSLVWKEFYCEFSSNDSTHRGCTVKYASKLRFSGAAIEVLFLFFSWPLYPSASFLAFAAFSALSSHALNNIIKIHVGYSYIRRYVIFIESKLNKSIYKWLSKWQYFLDSISAYNWFIGVWRYKYENQKSNILFLLYWTYLFCIFEIWLGYPYQAFVCLPVRWVSRPPYCYVKA